MSDWPLWDTLVFSTLFLTKGNCFNPPSISFISTFPLPLSRLNSWNFNFIHNLLFYFIFLPTLTFLQNFGLIHKILTWNLKPGLNPILLLFTCFVSLFFFLAKIVWEVFVLVWISVGTIAEHNFPKWEWSTELQCQQLFQISKNKQLLQKGENINKWIIKTNSESDGCSSACPQRRNVSVRTVQQQG